MLNRIWLSLSHRKAGNRTPEICSHFPQAKSTEMFLTLNSFLAQQWKNFSQLFFLLTEHKKGIENGLLLCSMPSQITIASSSEAKASLSNQTNIFFSRTVPRTASRKERRIVSGLLPQQFHYIIIIIMMMMSLKKKRKKEDGARESLCKADFVHVEIVASATQ